MVSDTEQELSQSSTKQMLQSIKDSMVLLQEEVSAMGEMLESFYPNTGLKEETI